MQGWRVACILLQALSLAPVVVLACDWPEMAREWPPPGQAPGPATGSNPLTAGQLEMFANFLPVPDLAISHTATDAQYTFPC